MQSKPGSRFTRLAWTTTLLALVGSGLAPSGLAVMPDQLVPATVWVPNPILGPVGCGPPLTPENLQVEKQSGENGAVNRLTWDPPRSLPGGQAPSQYRVFRWNMSSDTTPSFQLLAQVPAAQTSYDDAAVSRDAEYSYYVTAVYECLGQELESLPSTPAGGCMDGRQWVPHSNVMANVDDVTYAAENPDDNAFWEYRCTAIPPEPPTD